MSTSGKNAVACWTYVALCGLFFYPLTAATAGPASETLSTLLALMTVPGERGVVANGHQAQHEGHASFEQAEGWVNQALKTTESIRVELGKTMWVCIGLVRRAQASTSSTLELYARKWDCGGKTPSSEFFLVLRPEPKARPIILAQWVLESHSAAELFQRAFLDYDRGSRTAFVQITDGLDRKLLAATVPVSE
jgi:hypothetical protein